MATPEASEIFISYSRRDSPFVDRLLLTLKTAGYRVWRDLQSIRIGQQWPEEIVLAIEHCHFFVLVLSHHSVQSPNVAKEVALADACRRPIFPLQIDDCELSASLRYPLAGIQLIRQTPTGEGPLFEALLEALGLARQPLPSTEADASKTGSVDRDRLIRVLQPQYGPVIPLLLQSLPAFLGAADQQALATSLVEAGVDAVDLANAMAAARPQPAQRRTVDPLTLLRREIGPIAPMLLTDDLAQQLVADPAAAAAALTRRGVPAEVILRIIDLWTATLADGSSRP